MVDPLTIVPPTVVVFGLAVAVTMLQRRAGHALAAGVLALVTAWLLAVPAGSHIPTELFGFDAVLFHVDGFSRLIGVAFAFIATAGVGYAYTSGVDRRQTAFALAYVASGIGAVFAGDWLTLVVFWELMAAAATALVWHSGDDARIAVRYAIYHEVGGLLLMAGVLAHYAAAGTFLYGDGITAGLPAFLVALGIGLNAGFLGLHVWIAETYPSTHVAASVVLAAFTTKVGAYAILRAFPDGQVAVAYVGGLMVLFGVTMAILQTNARRLLSYHVVSQVGYVVAGFAAGSALASAGAVAHLVNNVLYKSLLFMIAGVLIQRTGVESLKKFGTNGRHLPLTVVAYLIAAFSITGVPGFNGFVSKGMVLDGVAKAGHEPLWWVLLVGSVGTVISFTKFGYYAFAHAAATDATPEYDGAEEATSTGADLTRLEGVVLGSVAVPCLALGLFPELLFASLPEAAVAAAKPYAQKQFVKAIPILLGGVVLFATVRKPLSRVAPMPDLDGVYNPLGAWIIRTSTRGATELEGAFQRAIAAGATILPRLSAATERRDDGQVGIGPTVFVVAFVLVIVLLVLLF